jgi:hypothetical protein
VRALAALLIVDTIGIGLIILTLSGTPQPPGAQSFLPQNSICAGAVPPGAPTAALDPEQLRTILRTELAQQLQAVDRAGSRKPSEPEVSRDQVADRTRRENVMQEIENYRGVGVITDEQLTRLQMQIAQLDPESRHQAAMRLIQAINRDEIKPES